MRWLTPSTRSSSSPRHLLLKLKPSNCRLRTGVSHQLLHPDRVLSKYPESPYPPRTASLSISLVAQTENGRVAFGHRSVSIRLWPSEHVEKGVIVDDLPATVVFDLSASIALLGSTPAALSLLLELRSDSPAAKPTNAYPATLRGELLLIDRSLEEAPVPNGRISVPLRFAATDASDAPPLPKGKPPLSTEHLVPEPSPDDDVINVDNAAPVGRRRLSGKARGKTPGATRQPDATLIIDVQGGVAHASAVLKSPERPRVYITCSYTARETPFWNGIIRHDFVCPWCHRNCYRFRTLLNHFQVEHDDMTFALEGLPGPGSAPDNALVKGPFTLMFEITAAHPNPEQKRREADRKKRISKCDKKGGRAPDEEEIEVVYANPVKYPSYGASASRRRKEADEVEAGMAKVSIKDKQQKSSSDTDSETTEFNDDDPEKDFLSTLGEELWNRCKNCQRQHPKSNITAVTRKDFCSEFCEIIYKKKMQDKDESPAQERGPMLEFSSVPRKPSFDYKEKLGHLELYHVVSVCEAKEEHYHEDDPDSEEEVDHSWRLDLSMERIRHLDDATPKEKLLWMMWNKFAHENYPLPSVYAERYTRYTLEWFALEYGGQIRELKLRVQFVGFVRALHIHGMIDSVAIISIMLCLDGKKKRREISRSSRPDISRDPLPRGRPQGSGRTRKGRKRNGGNA